MNASELGCGAAHQLAITAAKAGWELTDFTALAQSESACRKVLKFLRGEAELVANCKPQPGFDPIIRFDRSVRPLYPNWIKEVIHPELEVVGLGEYDISAVEQWLHNDQKDGVYIQGDKIYEHLKETDMLKTCLGLRDLVEIERKGIIFFRNYFGSKSVFGWASAVRDHPDYFRVPYLSAGTSKMIIQWKSSSRGWNVDDLALRFPGSPKF